MKEDLENIFNLVSDYINETQNDKWVEGEDWISYSGLVFDEKEYLAALRVLLSGWINFGKNARQFEIEFPKYLGSLLANYLKFYNTKWVRTSFR